MDGIGVMGGNGRMKLLRLMLQFTAPQVEFLRRESARLSITIPDLVRRIVDEYRERKRQ